MNDEKPRRVRHRTVGSSDANVASARKLRAEMSLPEVLLWRELRGKPMGMKFRRQFPVAGYVADFACMEARLLIEIDGKAHDMGERPERDAARDDLLNGLGWQVARYPARDVLADVAGAAASIVHLALRYRPLRPSGAPPRSGEDLA